MMVSIDWGIWFLSYRSVCFSFLSDRALIVNMCIPCCKTFFFCTRVKVISWSNFSKNWLLWGIIKCFKNTACSSCYYNIFLCPRIDRFGAYCFTSVLLSVCLLKTLPVNLTFSYNFHTIQVTMLIFGMQVAFDNTQLVRVISSRSRSNIKVTFFIKLPFRGH